MALARLSSLHHVSHQSHSSGSEKMGIWRCMLLGRSWSRLLSELGSADSDWYCCRRRSPAASWRNRLRSITYRAEMWYGIGPRCDFQ